MSKISKIMKRNKTQKNKNKNKNKMGGARYSAGGNKEQNQLLDFIFPRSKEKEKAVDLKFPYNASFNNDTFLGVDFRFYLPQRALTQSKYKYSIDDYMNYIRISKDGIPATNPNYNQVHEYVKLLQEKTTKINYFDAIYLIMKGDEQLGEIKCSTKGPPYKQLGEGKELFTALNIDFFDFRREANVRYLIYLFLEENSELKYFIISSDTSEFFKAVYSTFLLKENPEELKNTNIGISLLSGDEGCKYVRSCFVILLFCSMTDNYPEKMSTEIRKELEKDKTRVLREITKERNTFVERIKKLIQEKKSQPEMEIQEEHHKFFNDYIERVDKIIGGYKLFDTKDPNYFSIFKPLTPEIEEKQLYYLLVTSVSYSNLNGIIGKFATLNTMDVVENNNLPSEIMVTNEFMTERNIKSDKINDTNNMYETQINELFNIKRESITDYIKNGATIVVTTDDKKEIIVVQHIVFGVYFSIPEAESEGKTKPRVLIAIFMVEKTINLSKNYILDLTKFRWVLKKEDKELIIKSLDGIENVKKIMPFFDKIIPIEEAINRSSIDYNRAVILYPSLAKRVMFGLAAPISSLRRTIKRKPQQPQEPQQPREQQTEDEDVNRETNVSVDSTASTVIM